MSTRAKNKNLTKRILFLLLNNAELRDDWIGTIKSIHDEELLKLGIPTELYYETFFTTGKLSNIDTIKRIWALLQEKNKGLRGVTWEERQKQGGMIAREMFFIDPKQLKMFTDE
jgi:hypothetical protein